MGLQALHRHRETFKALAENYNDDKFRFKFNNYHSKLINNKDKYDSPFKQRTWCISMPNIDSIHCLKDNSVIVDNSTLAACVPFRTKDFRANWSNEPWAKTLINWGMSNLVESLILYEYIYVDQYSKYRSQLTNQITDQLGGLIRTFNIGQSRQDVINQIDIILNKNIATTELLTSIAYERQKESGYKGMVDLERTQGYLLDNDESHLPLDIIEEINIHRRFHPFVSRTYFYLLVSSIAKKPYVPYPIRNPIAFALSDQSSIFLDMEKHSLLNDELPDNIAKKILCSFDQYVRKEISGDLKNSPLGLPSLPMPSFWEIINNRSKGNTSEMINQIESFRKKARPYREYIGQIMDAYSKVDVEFLQRESKNLSKLQDQWRSNIGLPRLIWNKSIIPLKIKLPFVEVGELNLPLSYPELNPFRKPEYIFIHEYVSRSL